MSTSCINHHIRCGSWEASVLGGQTSQSTDSYTIVGKNIVKTILIGLSLFYASYLGSPNLYQTSKELAEVNFAEQSKRVSTRKNSSTFNAQQKQTAKAALVLTLIASR